MSTGLPSKDWPRTSGISFPTAGSFPVWGSSGRAVPVTTTGRVSSTPAADFFLPLDPPEEAMAATARTRTRTATPIHSHGGCFLRAAATAPVGLVSAMELLLGFRRRGRRAQAGRTG